MSRVKKFEVGDKCLKQSKQSGSVLVTTILLVLVLSCMVGVGIHFAKMQSDVAQIKRGASNPYYLAESAIKLQLEKMNTFIEVKWPVILEEYIRPQCVKQLIDHEKGVYYDSDQKELVLDERLIKEVRNQIYKTLCEEFVDGKTRTYYEVPCDDQLHDSTTKVELSIMNLDEENKKFSKERLIIRAIAQTKDHKKSYNKLTLEAVLLIYLPDEFAGKLHEYYELKEDRIPDLLKNGVLCYSDVLVRNSGKLYVEGDLCVGGKVEDMDGTLGGIVVSEGGKMVCLGNAYCTRNVLAVGGEEAGYEKTQIEISDDVIAHSMEIKEQAKESVEEDKETVQNVSIQIGKNAMLDEEVKINRESSLCKIEVGETLFMAGAELDEQGMKGHMTLMRSLLFSGNLVGMTTPSRFEEVIDLNELPQEAHPWSYSTPIEVVSSSHSRVKVSRFYVDEGSGYKPYPTLIINPRPEVVLRIEAEEEKDTFRGWIISAGPVKIGKGIRIEGGLIIGGPQMSIMGSSEEIVQNEGLVVEEGQVNICYDPDVIKELLHQPIKEQVLFRKILDALYLTGYCYRSKVPCHTGESCSGCKRCGGTAAILDKQGVNTQAALEYSDQSVLEVDIQDFCLELESIKQI